MDMSNLWNLTTILLEGLGTTLSIFILTLVIGIPAGIIVAIAQNSNVKSLLG